MHTTNIARCSVYAGQAGHALLALAQDEMCLCMPVHAEERRSEIVFALDGFDIFQFIFCSPNKSMIALFNGFAHNDTAIISKWGRFRARSMLRVLWAVQRVFKQKLQWQVLARQHRKWSNIYWLPLICRYSDGMTGTVVHIECPAKIAAEPLVVLFAPLSLDVYDSN